MSKSILYFSAVLLFFFACTKETLVFDSNANENYEFPLLLDFDEKPVFLDEPNNLIKFPINQTDLANFSPFVEFQDYSTILLNNQPLNNNTINNFSSFENHKTYPLSISANGETRVFDFIFTTIPTVQIITLDRILNEPKTLGRIILNYASTNKDNDNELLGIEYRGASSLNNEKKSFGFEILKSKDIDDVKISQLFDLRTTDKWMLEAMVVDKSRSRNKTSFEIWKSMGNEENHKYVSSKYVEVFHNHESLGLFSLAENMSGELLTYSNNSVLIEGILSNEFTKFEKLPKKRPGGEIWGTWEHKYPDYRDQTNWNQFEAFCSLVVNGSDEEFSNEIFNYLDFENAVDYFLLVYLISGSDNLGKNYFFGKSDYNEKFQIIPWDMDATWGRNWRGEENSFYETQGNSLFARLIDLNSNNYKTRVKERWFELRSGVFSTGNIIDKFSENLNELQMFQIEEMENRKWGYNLIFQQEQQFINNYIYIRLGYLDEHFANL